MRILLTGGAGYIGSHTLLALLAEGPHTVAEIRDHLGLPTDKKARNVIDRARREGHAVKNIGPCTFGFER